MASIAMEINNPDCALTYTEKVLQYWIDRANTTKIRNRDLAVGYLQHAIALLIFGKYGESEAELKTGLAIMETVIGDDREKMSTWMLNLGYAYWLQGKLDDAESTLRDGLAERIKKFGRDDVYSYK